MSEDPGFVPQRRKAPSVPQKTEFKFPIQTAPGKIKINKRILTLGAVVLAAVVLLWAAVQLVGGMAQSRSTAKPATLSARLNEDGTAYIPMLDGTAVEIDEEVALAVLTADRKHIVVRLEDGTLYVTDPKLKSKHVLSEDCTSLGDLKNDGLVYRDEDGVLYRVLFSDYTPLELGEDVSFTSALNSISLLLADEDGDVYTLAAKSQDKKKIGSYDDRARLLGISDDAKTAVWINMDDENHILHIQEGDEDFELTESECDESYCGYVSFSEDQKMVMVGHDGEDRVWFKKVGKEPVSVKMGSENFSYSFFTASGSFSRSKASQADSLYSGVIRDSDLNVYHFNLKGDRERVLARVSSAQVANGTIFYLDDDQTLYHAKLKGDTIGEETKIAKDVASFYVRGNGKYVYYFKDANSVSEEATLYCYQFGKEEPVKVASDIFWESYMGPYTTANGKTVLFFKDMDQIKNTYVRAGALMMWTYGDDSAEKVANDVVYGSISSGLNQTEFRPKDFIFLKYGSVDSDGSILCDWMHYNGKEASRFAADVIR